jgi:hypothetical protein
VDALVHDLFFEEAVPNPSHAALTQAVITCAKEAFSQHRQVVEQDHRFMNLIYDGGTVANIKAVHCAIANPTHLPDIFPLEPYKNENRTAERCKAFFRETVKSLSDDTPAMEICEVICDDLPAWVVERILCCCLSRYSHDPWTVSLARSVMLFLLRERSA